MSPSEQDRNEADDIMCHGWATEHPEAEVPTGCVLVDRARLTKAIAQALADAREQAVKPFIDAGLSLPNGMPKTGPWYIRLSDGSVRKTHEYVHLGILLDTSDYGVVVGVEILSPAALAPKEPRE